MIIDIGETDGNSREPAVDCGVFFSGAMTGVIALTASAVLSENGRKR